MRCEDSFLGDSDTQYEKEQTCICDPVWQVAGCLKSPLDRSECWFSLLPVLQLLAVDPISRLRSYGSNPELGW